MHGKYPMENGNVFLFFRRPPKCLRYYSTLGQKSSKCIKFADKIEATGTWNLNNSAGNAISSFPAPLSKSSPFLFHSINRHLFTTLILWIISLKGGSREAGLGGDEDTVWAKSERSVSVYDSYLVIFQQKNESSGIEGVWLGYSLTYSVILFDKQVRCLLSTICARWLIEHYLYFE